jgi:hypothetical protein
VIGDVCPEAEEDDDDDKIQIEAEVQVIEGGDSSSRLDSEIEMALPNEEKKVKSTPRKDFEKEMAEKLVEAAANLSAEADKKDDK